MKMKWKREICKRWVDISKLKLFYDYVYWIPKILVIKVVRNIIESIFQEK